MRKKEISKVGLSLLIALAFVIPTGAMAYSGPGENEAGEIQLDIERIKNNDNIGSLFNDGPFPVQIQSCEFGTIMKEDCYDINITIERPAYSEGFTPLINGDIVESGWSPMPGDPLSEDDAVSSAATCDVIWDQTMTTSWDIFALMGQHYTLRVNTWDETDRVRVRMTNPLDFSGIRWDQAGDSLTLFRDYDDDGEADWLLRYNWDGTTDFYWYVGPGWTWNLDNSMLAAFDSYAYDGTNFRWDVEWTATGGLEGKVASRLINYDGANYYWAVTPCAATQTYPHVVDPEDTTTWLQEPGFHSMDLEIFMAADCTNIYLAFRSLGDPIDQFDLDVGGVLFDEASLDIVFAGLGTNELEIEIPRSLLPVGDCNELAFPIDYVMRGTGPSVRNEGCIIEDDVDNVIIFDCECVLLKAFVDIYKMGPLDCEIIYETDFEDPADIYNHWDSFEGTTLDGSSPGGAIDTFRWNDYMSHSPGHSFHNSFLEDTYLGNQVDDYLQTCIINEDDEGEPYDNIEISFWHYMIGEEITLTSALTPALFKPLDYGEFEYSLDGGPWNTVPVWQVDDWCSPDENGSYDPFQQPGYYYMKYWVETEDENPYSPTFGEITWLQEKGKLYDVGDVDEICFRWKWNSNACIENLGWYIDDVSICGEQQPDPYDFVAQMYSVEAFEMCEETMKYTFPNEYCFTEGEWRLNYWLLVEDDCHFAVHDQENRFTQEFEIRDYCEFSITNNLPDGNLYFEGDDVIVETTVTNHGTICCYDVPVTFEVKERLVTTHYDDLVEGLYYDTDYIPYQFENPDANLEEIQCVNFGDNIENPDYPQSGYWRIAELDFVSPTHHWFLADASDHYPAGIYDAIAMDFTVIGFDIGAFENEMDWDVTMKLNANVFQPDPIGNPALGDVLYAVIVFGNSWSSFGGSRDYTIPLIGASTGGWVDFSFVDAFTACGINYGIYNPDENPIITFARQYSDHNDVTEATGIGVLLSDYARANDCFGQPAGDWSGVMLDNFKITSITEGETIYEDVIIIEEICPGETIELLDCDGFIWEDAITGNWFECKSVPLDDPRECHWLNKDNEACDVIKVISDIGCWEDCDIEHYDLDAGYNDNYWHICSSGYDNYLVDNDPETGTYDYSPTWNDAIILKSDDPRNKDSEASMDMSGIAVLNIEYDSLEDFEGFPDDQAWIEVNPAVSEPGSVWYGALGAAAMHGLLWAYFPLNVEWVHRSFDFVPGDFMNWDSGAPEALPGWTDDMGVRFRFYAPDNWFGSGWYLDDIIVYGDYDDEDGVIYELNECDDMDRFILDYQTSGDWWFESSPGCWTLQDQVNGNIPNYVENTLVWDTEIGNAYYAELTFEICYDLENTFDYAFLEFSTDGGSNWISVLGWTGAGCDTPVVDITPYIGQDLLIRIRVSTDSGTRSGFVTVCDMCIIGFVDNNPPVTTGTISGTMTHGWYSSPVTFTATATDDVSGVFATYYKIDGGSTLTYSAPITISVNGLHQIEYWSVDNVGNEEAHKFTCEFQIDTGSAPSVSLTAPTPGLYLFGNQILSMSNVFIIGGFTAEATASDADSGVYKVEFQLDGTTFGEATSAPFSAYCGLKHTGDATITAIAEDFTGQTAQDTMSIKYFKFL